MTRNQLLCVICPSKRMDECKNYKCADCNILLNRWFDDYDKYVIEQYNENTGLNSTIREIHDNVAREMYCKGIDDFAEKLKDYFIIPHDARVIEMTAEQLKEQKK